MIYNESTDKLYEQIEESKKLLKKATNKKEIFALTNYIGNIYKAIYEIDGEVHDFDRNNIFGVKRNYNKFIKRLDIYNDRLLNNFIINKDFHREYIGEILSGVEEELSKITEICEYDDEIEENDFNDLLHDFMISINQEDLINKYIESNSIYSPQSNGTNNLGYTSYNPVTGTSNIFIRNFQYDLKHLHTLIHELGHCYDFNKIGIDINKYNEYYYTSIYTEVLSRLFERLFINFMHKNNIMKGAVQYQLYEFEMINHNFLLQTYLISLIKNDRILKHKDLEINTDFLKKELKNYIEKDDYLLSIIKDSVELDIGQTLCYTYGDIFSLLLNDIYKSEGINGKDFDEFIKFRTNMFNVDHLVKYELSPDKYLDLYNKEIQLIKR